MKSISKTLAIVLSTTGFLFPSIVLAANGNITARLLGHSAALSVLNYKLVGRPYYNVLPTNKFHIINFKLKRGYNYNMTASCDRDFCQDVDLRLLDRRGNIIDSDLTKNSDPKVGLLVRRTDTYYVQVIMRGCKRVSCEYGVQLLYQQK